MDTTGAFLPCAVPMYPRSSMEAGQNTGCFLVCTASDRALSHPHCLWATGSTKVLVQKRKTGDYWWVPENISILCSAKACFLPYLARVYNRGTEMPPPTPGPSLTTVILVGTETTNSHPGHISQPLGSTASLVKPVIFRWLVTCL